jgi:hypothetical protein
LEDEDVDEDDNEDADDLEGEEENEVLLRASNYIFFLIIYSWSEGMLSTNFPE